MEVATLAIHQVVEADALVGPGLLEHGLAVMVESVVVIITGHFFSINENLQNIKICMC